MTERERWTVYPLLFLSLGIGLRSHITSSLELNEIGCHTLKSRKVEIVDADDKVQLVLSDYPDAGGGGGDITIFSAEGKPEVVLRAHPHGGLVELASARGVLQVRLAVAPVGGVVETFDPPGKTFRALAVAVDPRLRGEFRPAPAPPAGESPAEPGSEPAEEPAGEPAEPKTETPASPDQPAGEASAGDAEPPKEPAAR